MKMMFQDTKWRLSYFRFGISRDIHGASDWSFGSGRVFSSFYKTIFFWYCSRFSYKISVWSCLPPFFSFWFFVLFLLCFFFLLRRICLAWFSLVWWSMIFFYDPTSLFQSTANMSQKELFLFRHKEG